MPWALSPDIDMNKWYLRYRNNSPLRHEDWDAFRDPDEVVYRSYNVMQDGHETYVDGLLRDHARNAHDAGLGAGWVAALARLYTPTRYPLHCLQMGSAYLVQIVPASTIENCAMFQAADSSAGSRASPIARRSWPTLTPARASSRASARRGRRTPAGRASANCWSRSSWRTTGRSTSSR